VVRRLSSKELELTLYFLINFALLRRRTLRFGELDLVSFHLSNFDILRLVLFD
jgi:hypothetical protein